MAIIDDLIAYWALDEASGNAVDSHGSHTGVETNGTIPSTTGQVGGARDFELDDTEYFAVAHHANLVIADTPVTIAQWVRAESLGGVSKASLGKDNTNSSTHEFILGYQGASDRLRFVAYDAATGAVPTVVAADDLGAPSTGVWYLMIAWHDPAADQIGIRVNNGTVNTAAHAGGLYASGNPLALGAQRGLGAGALHWDGLIDETMFWRRLLTADEQAWLWNGGAGRSYADIVAASAAGQPMMRRWGGVPYVGGQGIGNKGLGRAFGYPIK